VAGRLNLGIFDNVTGNAMAERDGKKEHQEPNYDELAKYILCAWIAYRLGVTLPTAKRQVERALHPDGKQHPGAIWYHVSEYVEKLQAGYLRFDLNKMTRDDPGDSKEPQQWVQ
jgi:hypothetical protein